MLSKNLISQIGSSEIFKKNISILKIKFPRIYDKIEQYPFDLMIEENIHSKKMVNNLKNNNLSHNSQKLFSLFNPTFDQNCDKTTNLKLQSEDLVFCIGLGSGHTPIAALKTNKSKPRIIVMETQFAMFNLVLRVFNLEPLLSYERLGIHVDPEINCAKIVEIYKDLIPVGKNYIFRHKFSDNTANKKYFQLELELKERIQTFRDRWYTGKKNGKRMLTNTIMNLSSLVSGTAMNYLMDIYKGVPAFCIAAGPSLNMGLSLIQNLQNTALIIACDSSVNALLKAGIKPHFVVTTDIFNTNFEKVKYHVDRLRDSILIYGIESNPDNVRKFLGNKRIAVSSNSKILLNWLDLKWNLNCRLPYLTSVSQMAIYSALAVGADPIVLVGMDLSYNKGKSHSAGSVIQENLNMSKVVKTSGVKGTKKFSSPQLVADKIFLEGEIAKSKTRFINTSMDGALIKGTEIKSIDEILATDLGKKADVSRLMSEIDWAPLVNETDALNELSSMLQRIVEFKEVCDSNDQIVRNAICAGQNKINSVQTSEQFTKIKRDFEAFKHKNSLLFGILELAIVEDIHEILKKRERIAAKDYHDQHKKKWDETDLIRYQYKAYSKAADFVYKRLRKICSNLNKALSLKQARSDDNARDQWKKHRDLGRHYAKIEEIWQAEREYRNAIQIRLEDPSPWLELVQMYTDSELWRPACEYVEKACRLFPKNMELINLKADIEVKVEGIMNQIKEAWVTGDKETTRRLLNGYLLLRPDDEQANLLKQVLKELDDTLAADSPIQNLTKVTDTQFDEFLGKAVQCIEKLEFDEAIGIIEGLIEILPEKAAILREKIGDCRMLQKDSRSAIWNYEQVLKLDPEDFGIKSKINKAKKDLEFIKKHSIPQKINNQNTFQS